jgi:hypothetical protein
MDQNPGLNLGNERTPSNGFNRFTVVVPSDLRQLFGNALRNSSRRPHVLR